MGFIMWVVARLLIMLWESSGSISLKGKGDTYFFDFYYEFLYDCQMIEIHIDI
jgi:hypothetical protein